MKRDRFEQFGKLEALGKFQGLVGEACEVSNIRDAGDF